MMKTGVKVAVVLLMACWARAQGRTGAEPSPPEPRWSLATTYLSFLNWGEEKTNTHHYEFHLRYALSKARVVGVKVATWELFAPMGIQFWEPGFLEESGFYPGKLEERGIGVTYQHALWKNLFASIEVLPLVKRYRDEEGKVAGRGFKLYTSYHLGYRFTFFSERFYLEPQVHGNYWPLDTEGPGAFEDKEKAGADFFLFEPNLYLGISF